MFVKPLLAVQILTLVLLRVFPKHIFQMRVVATPLWILNTEGHVTLNLLPVYSYGHPLSTDNQNKYQPLMYDLSMTS